MLPASAARIGEAKSRKVAAEEMGFPGRPKKTCVDGGSPLRGSSPKTRGLPGWIFTPVKWKLAPMRESAGSTRSYLPAETPPEMRSMSAWAADGLLAIFFFVVGVELKREFVAGDLRDPRRAALPIAAAVGGMLVEK